MTISVWILGDQLLDHHPVVETALNRRGRSEVRVVMIESQARLTRLPYHRQKLTIILSAMRHYAAQLRERGWSVDYVKAPDFLTALQRHVTSYNPRQLLTMAASERGGRQFQRDLDHRLGIPVEVFPNTQFLTGRYNPAPGVEKEKRYTQERFYRAMRQNFHLLIDEEGEPSGGRWNFDFQNRQKLPVGMALPPIMTFQPDQITQGVLEEVMQYTHAVGRMDGFNYAVTRAGALAALDDFVSNRLLNYGAYQDAMRADGDILFHSCLSPYLNLGLLTPLEVAQRVEQAYRQDAVSINAVEGFIRQVIGWREYIYWQYWRQGADYRRVNDWGFTRPLPEFFWTGDTALNCQRAVLQRVLRSAYAHHIERLMVLSNFCLLAEIHPSAVNDWFLSNFIDAYEWVMLPNVLGMGLYADGGLTATKPYIASANYLHKMSNYCQGCRYDYRQRTGPEACPYNFLYWHFMIRHESVLRSNPRMGASLLGLRRIDEGQRQEIQQTARDFLEALA